MNNSEELILSAFHSAAQQAPFYQSILKQAGIEPDTIKTLDDFKKFVPILDKKSTFGTFPLEQLCRNGNIGRPASVLTSSGHSGLFAFGMYNADSADSELDHIDNALDILFQVRDKKTLMINCLPMGVLVFSHLCTVAHTSVREDMVTALVRKFSQHYDQIILLGEAAFIKLVLELGLKQGIDWKNILVHVIVGEEPLAENARKYLNGILGIDIKKPENGMLGSSMGVAELGLNLFFEAPPLIGIRRFLHDSPVIRKMVLGASATIVPMIFTYDPRRTFVEVMENDDLVLSSLNLNCPIPLIRYRTGDRGFIPNPKLVAKYVSDAAKESPLPAGDFPLIAIEGRGECVSAGNKNAYPEEVKEGIYHDPELAKLITANFRLYSGEKKGLVRIQLSPGIPADPSLNKKFAKAIAKYTQASLEVQCEPFETFNSGMNLDYERKFGYIEK
jgi:phenylacetate-CoA ligase